MSTHSIEEALQALRAGKPILVVDDEDRENEGDLILSAEFATTEALAFMVRHGSGVICVALPGERLDALHLPLMVANNSDSMGTAYTVSVDYRHGTTTGISAADRAATCRALVDRKAAAEDFNRPGHIFPLRAREGGVLVRAGHTEAAVDLTRLAGLKPGGVLVEIVNDDGSMARRPQLEVFAKVYDLVLISVAQLRAWRRQHERIVDRTSSCLLPTPFGVFTMHGYREDITGQEHIALTLGDVSGASDVLVRVHSECLTGEAFSSMRCNCRVQLTTAMERIGLAGVGAVVYLRGHEGRGIGLMHKLRAYALQDQGCHTVQANLHLGHPADENDYAVGAQILRDLDVRGMRLMTNNPKKYEGLNAFGLHIVSREPLLSPPTHADAVYLSTKQRVLGHLLELP